MPITDQLRANRENAKQSSGPVTIAGKARSSQNALKHGLASGRLLIEGESSEEFEKLHAGFVADHQPANNTEAALVHDIARHRWLLQRATTLQSESFDANKGEPPANLLVLMRYETTHERGFHKALATLRSLQKDRQKANGFVSQETKTPDKRSLLKKAIWEKHADDVFDPPEPGQPNLSNIDIDAVNDEIDASTDEELDRKYSFLLGPPAIQGRA